MTFLPGLIACSAGHPLMLLGIFESPVVQIGLAIGAVFAAASLVVCMTHRDVESDF